MVPHNRELCGSPCKYFFDLPNEGVPLVLEYPDLLNGSKVRERLLQQLLGEAVHDAAAVHRAVRRRRLIVHLVKRQRFRVGCNFDHENKLLL